MLIGAEGAHSSCQRSRGSQRRHQGFQEFALCCRGGVGDTQKRGDGAEVAEGTVSQRFAKRQCLDQARPTCYNEFKGQPIRAFVRGQQPADPGRGGQVS